MDYNSIILTFKSVLDIDITINKFTRKAKSLRKNAVDAPSLNEKLAINKEIKAINEVVFKLKLNYFKLEDRLRNNG